jgi:hypothetical protein
MMVGGLYRRLAASGGLNEASAEDNKANSAQAYGSRLLKPDSVFTGRHGEDYKESIPSFPKALKAEGSPNVLLILLDDVGFGVCSTFGGPVLAPHMQKLVVGRRDNGVSDLGTQRREGGSWTILGRAGNINGLGGFPRPRRAIAASLRVIPTMQRAGRHSAAWSLINRTTTRPSVATSVAWG